MTLGGRAAEELVFSEVTTGASNDIEKVTATAKQMVMRFGMSEKLGPRVFGHDHGMPFLGREFSSEPDYSDDVAREIDDEIRRVVEEAHQSARDILDEKREQLDHTSEILLRRETIERDEFIQLLEGKSEIEVFGEDEPVLPQGPPPAPEVPAASRSASRNRSRVPAWQAVQRRCPASTRPRSPTPHRPLTGPNAGAMSRRVRARRAVALAVLFGLLAVAAALAAKRALRVDRHGARVEHFDLRSKYVKRTLREAVVVPHGSDGEGRPLLVFLHGRGGHEDDNLRGPMFAALRSLGARAPVVVFPEGGRASYWHDRRGGAWDGTCSAR